MVATSRNKTVLEQTNCPSCPSSDAFTVYEQDGKYNGHCYSCGIDIQDLDFDSSYRSPTPKSTGKNYTGSSNLVSLDEGYKYPVVPILSRKLSKETCERFGVRVGVSSVDGVTPEFTLFPRYKKGNLVGYKTVDKHKNIVNSGGNNVDPFGLHLIKPKGKKLWITEGEWDCLSVYQSLKENSGIPGWEPDVISIPDGATSAANSLTRHYDKLIAFDEIILVFDNDEPGTKATEEVCKLFSGKVSYVSIPSPYKDASDLLQDNKANELKWLCLSNYTKYKPDSIVDPKDLWDRYKSKTNSRCYKYPSIFPMLNEKTYGVRPASIVTVTSGTGCGKTQFMREMMYHFYQTTEEKIAGVFLEEGVEETMQGLIALDLNKRISLPDVKVTEEDEKSSFERLFDSSRFNLYDHFGGLDDNNLLSNLRYLAVTGHRFIFLDHLSIIVSEFASQGGERERIDTLMTKLAKFVKEFGVVLFLVVHLRKNTESGKSFEEGVRPTLDDLRGSGSLKQLSWDVLFLTRNQQHTDPFCANTVEVSVGKCRFTGRTGIADYVNFDEKTGRLYNIPKPDNLFHKKLKVQQDGE